MSPHVRSYIAPLRNACVQGVVAAWCSHSTLVPIWFPPKPEIQATIITQLTKRHMDDAYLASHHHIKVCSHSLLDQTLKSKNCHQKKSNGLFPRIEAEKRITTISNSKEKLRWLIPNYPLDWQKNIKWQYIEVGDPGRKNGLRYSDKN